VDNSNNTDLSVVPEKVSSNDKTYLSQLQCTQVVGTDNILKIDCLFSKLEYYTIINTTDEDGNTDSFLICHVPDSLLGAVTLIASMACGTGILALPTATLTTLLFGSRLETCETVIILFYEEFLPGFFLDNKASLSDQVLVSQKLTTVISLSGTTYILDADIQSYLVDILNDNQDQLIEQLSATDLDTFDSLIQANAA